MNNSFRITSLLIMASMAVAACTTATPTPPPTAPPLNSDAVVAEGHLMPRDDMYVMFALRGKVAEVLATKGQVVNAGDVLARLGDREPAEATLALAQLELTNAQLAYDTLVRTGGLTHAQAWLKYLEAQTTRATAARAWEALDTDALDDEIETAEADTKTREDELKDAQDEFDKYRALKEDNATRKTAETALTTAQETYNEAVRKWEELLRRRDTLQIALDVAHAAEAEAQRNYETTAPEAVSDALMLAQTRLATAKAQVAAAELNLANYDLTAPFAGIVTDINVSAGESVSTDKWAIQMADTSQWYIETSDLTELEVVKVSEGQTVTLVPDALTDLEMTGVVESISIPSKLQSGDVVYTVRIRVEDVDERLRWGMTFEVTFEP